MGKKRAEYRCVTTSVEGFVQQVAVQYLRHGYWFYVAGKIPEGKDPTVVDAKLIKRYGIDVSRWERARRKRAGLANMQYIRQDRFFLLMATHGLHWFFEDEAGQIRDARRVPIRFAGYSLSFRGGHSSVRIQQALFGQLKHSMMVSAPHASSESLIRSVQRLRFEPYAPIRQQLRSLIRAINRARSQAGLATLPLAPFPWKRRPVRPFDSLSSNHT